MDKTYCHQEKLPQYEKHKAITPGTADSEYFKSCEQLHQKTSVINQLFSFWGNQALFQKSTMDFLGYSQQPDEMKQNQDHRKLQIQENLINSDISISIVVYNQNNTVLKNFKKSICKIIENQDQINLIFDRQYQKIQVVQNQQYMVQFYINTKDGFSRKLWSKIIKNISYEQQIFIVNDQDAQFQFNAEIQSMCKTYLKPLCFRVPLQSIQKFYDEKYKLLNKSDLLNSIAHLSQLKGIFYTLTQQNMGSRILQKLLQKANKEEIEQFVNQLESNLQKMAVDKYGNYVLQKIFKVSNSQMRKRYLECLSKNFIELLKTKAGTHSLQDILSRLNEEQVLKIVDYIANNIVDLCQDQFGTHFMQKFIQICPDYKLIELLFASFTEICCNKYGIVVMKVLMKVSSLNQYLRINFLNNCLNNFNQLAFQEYGHYIIIEIFNYYGFYEIQNMLQHIANYISLLSQNQYSSNIVHKGVDKFGDYLSIPIIEQLQHCGVDKLMQSSPGSFVLHRLLDHTTNQYYQQILLNKMKAQCTELKNYEKRVKWMKFLQII